MSIDEQELRAAFRDIADATPIPDRWDEIVVGSARARRRRTIVTTGSAVVALAAAIAIGVVATGGVATKNRFVVKAGAPRRAAVSVFPGGPTVAIGDLASGRLAFVSDSHLFVVDAAGQTARQLTTSGDASALSWSADGQWLAFTVRNAPGYEDYTTWITRADGTGARALDGMGDTFTWSPTGHQLAINGFCCTSSQRGGLFVVDPEHGHREVAPDGMNVTTIVWSPDGKTVGYTESVDRSGRSIDSLWTVRADGRDLAQVGVGDLISWSPNGRSLLVKADNRVRLLGLSGHASTLGTSVGLDARDASAWSAFSSDGTEVAVVADRGDRSANAIVVCHTDGSACRTVAHSTTEIITGPAFSPDGTQLTFVADRALRVVTIATGTVTELDALGRNLLQGAGDGIHITRGTAADVPAWLTDGTILYWHGPELRIIDPATHVSQRIASPIGFSNAGPSDQGLPGGTPVAASNLTSRGLRP